MVNSKLMEVMEILQDHDIRTDDLKQKTDDGVEVIEALLTWEDNHKSDKDFIGSSMSSCRNTLHFQTNCSQNTLLTIVSQPKAVVEKVEAEFEQEESEEDAEAELEKFLEMVSEEYPELVDEVAEDAVIDTLIQAEKEDDIEWREHFTDVLNAMGIELTQPEPEVEEPEPEVDHVHDENCTHEDDELDEEDEEEEDEEVEIPMVSPEEFVEAVEDIIESEPQEAKTIDNQFQEPITPPSVARPGNTPL